MHQTQQLQLANNHQKSTRSMQASEKECALLQRVTATIVQQPLHRI
jgi:hypothetical protein